MLENFDPLSLNYKKNYNSYITNFLNELNEMSKEIVNNAWDSLKVVKFFSREFKRDIKDLKDFIEIDKLMCDYHNMICCVFASRDGLNFYELEFKHPRFKDNYECRILKGFEIIFDRSKNKADVKLDKLVLFQAVKALDTENCEHCLEIDIDYFLYFFENGFSVRFTLEKIKEKKIKKIQVITTNEKFNKVFKVLLKE